MSFTKKRIVLDLDNTLIISSKTAHSGYDFLISFDDDEISYYVKKRNFCDEFLRFCFLYFNEVVVWSAGVDDYVHEIVRNIFPCNPSLILTRNDIEFIDTTYTKPLRQIFNNIMRTYIIDDRVENFSDNINNAILIPAFYGEQDYDLLKIQTWFLNDNVIQSDINVTKNWKNITKFRYLVDGDRIHHINRTV